MANRYPVKFLALALILGAQIVFAAETPNFSRDILPILSDNCFSCHGPDEKARKGKLRLDTHDGALRKDEAVIVAGKSSDSELIKRIISKDDDERMPPPKSKRTLSEKQVDLLKRWIDAGAPWGKHWAYEAPQRPEVPAAAGAHNAIDNFILTRLARENLKQSPPAAKETLIRRVTLDLTGVPPTPAEVDAFVADNSADAYEKVVDRLFKSPRYGERMAWEWLDAARYADTNGYQGDQERTMWPWRDWVIKAFNENMPYDRFTVEQLAGDLLPNSTRDQKLATAFNRNHMINGEGGRIAAENRVDYVMDQSETTATIWLGITMNCARCHDHKFDPFTQKEYYSMFAFFNNTPVDGGGGSGQTKPTIDMVTPEQEKRIAEAAAKEEDARKERETIEKKLRDAAPEWERSLLAAPGKVNEGNWTVLQPNELKSDGGATLTKLEDGAILVSGKSPEKDTYTIGATTQLREITAFKLEIIPDKSFVNGGVGRADNGNFGLTGFKVQNHGKEVEFAGATADFEQTNWKAEFALDKKNDTGWAVHPEVAKPHHAVFIAKEPIGTSNTERVLTIKLEFLSVHKEHTLGKFRVSISTDPAHRLRAIPEKIRAIVTIDAAKRSDAQKKELGDFYLDSHPEFAQARKKRDDAKKARQTAESGSVRVMVMEEGKARDAFVLTRGAYDKPGEKVSAGVPASLGALSANASKNRLGLAQWLVSPANPLTARVTVNRYWQMFFGLGIVKTSEDFGVQGEKPVHPELLDWLATEFVRTNWDVKALCKMIVLSSAYRQSSKTTAELIERDPENRLLARGPRFRMPSWMLRDQALAASGLLVENVGGPSVKVYQPAGIWEEATFGQITYKQDHGEKLYRRSLYIFWRRIVGPTMFFDNAPRQTCIVKPFFTNTPLHALTTLNDVTYVEAARAMAQRVIENGGETAQSRVEFAFKVATGRSPKSIEREILTKRLDELLKHYDADKAAAEKLLKTGESKRNEKIPAAEHAAYTGLCSLILNLDETVTKE